MTEIGAFAVDTDARTVEGILLPFGETSRLSMSKTEPIYFSADAVDLPTDPSIVTLNREHDQFSPIGRAVVLEKRDEGVFARFRIASTPEGDAFLTDEYPSGKFKKLSAEILGIVRDTADKARAVAGKITGAALTSEGAFASAALFSADGSGETVSSYESKSEYADGSEYSDKTETTEEEEDLGDGRKRVTRTTVTVTEVKEPDAPANTKEETVGVATVPATLAASAANLVTPSDQIDINEQSARDVFTLITAAQEGNEAAEKMLAALTDIKTSPNTAGTLGNVIQPAWLGEVWKEKTYVRRYMPLIVNGTITAQDEKGFTVSAGTEPVQPWAGNKTAVPSSGGTTEVLSSVFQRWGWAADIAREYYDIPGNTAVIEAFLRLVNNSYARQTDKWTLAQLVAAATIVAPDTYPTLDPTRDYPVAIKQLIQGVDAVSADPIDDTPAFAIVNPAAWRQIIYAPKDALPEWISLDFGITDQGGAADGKVRVVRGDLGIDDTPAVLVGARDSAHVNELGGASPLNLSALDIANGGIDKAVIGYTQFMADYADALVIVGAADA